MQETPVYSWVRKIPWRRERLPTPVFWPGEFQGGIVLGVAKTRTRLSNFHFHTSTKDFRIFNYVFLVNRPTYQEMAFLLIILSKTYFLILNSRLYMHVNSLRSISFLPIYFQLICFFIFKVQLLWTVYNWSCFKKKSPT